MNDPFSHHEALDRAHVFVTMFEDFLINHAFIKAHPTLAARCDQIGEALGDLYQAIGAIEDLEPTLADDDTSAERWDNGMVLADFRIGMEFTCSDRVWRCTDVGTRVITAIRVDQVEVASSTGSTRTLTRAEAEAERWFTGPPYAVAESVFDEYAMPGCQPVTHAED